MRKDEINRTLLSMQGKLFTYLGEKHRILRYTYTNVIRIVTDKKDLTFMPEDFNSNDFQEVAESVDVIESSPNKYTNTPTVPTLLNNQALISTKGAELADVLISNIEKVKVDKDYVPQAMAINDTVKQFIELAKTEVALIHATRL